MSEARSALVLTAGLGTRLHPLTLVRAKPAMPVGDVPLVRRILSWLACHGVEHAVLNLHYRPETITAVVGDGSDLGLRVRYSWEEPIVLGSAGGPRLALPLIGAETFLLVNGDTLTDVDLEVLLRTHESTKALVTLALTPNREPLRYSGLHLNPAGHVVGLAPKGPGAEGSFHFVGVQAVQASAFTALTPGVFANSIGDFYNKLADRWPGSVMGCVSEPSFHDIGTVEDYLATSRQFNRPGHAGARTTIAPTASVRDSILWDDVAIGEGAIVEDCIVTDRVRIRDGECHRHAILVAGATELQTFPLPHTRSASSNRHTT